MTSKTHLMLVFLSRLPSSWPLLISKANMYHRYDYGHYSTMHCKLYSLYSLHLSNGHYWSLKYTFKAKWCSHRLGCTRNTGTDSKPSFGKFHKTHQLRIMFTSLKGLKPILITTKQSNMWSVIVFFFQQLFCHLWHVLILMFYLPLSWYMFIA